MLDKIKAQIHTIESKQMDVHSCMPCGPRIEGQEAKLRQQLPFVLYSHAFLQETYGIQKPLVRNSTHIKALSKKNIVDSKAVKWRARKQSGKATAATLSGCCESMQDEWRCPSSFLGALRGA